MLADDGCWAEVRRTRRGVRVPALFLDRDGVIIEERGNICRAEDVRLIGGAAAVIRAANKAGIPIVVVTNQSGIGRRLFGWADFAAVQARMMAKLAAEGASLDAIYACPHHPAGVAPYRHADHPTRKPNPGMLLEAARALDLDLARSWIAGDRATDIEAGRNAGLAGGLHVETGYGSEPGQREAALALAAAGRYGVLAAASLRSAVDLLPLFRGDAPGAAAQS